MYSHLDELREVLANLRTPHYRKTIETIATEITRGYTANLEGKMPFKVVAFGNGGSQEQASHLVTELMIRYKKDNMRPSLAAIVLSDPGVLTAAANDFGYTEVFSRQIESLVNAGDVAIGLSTSGTSKNIILGLEEARRKRALTIALTGEKGITTEVDYTIEVPSQNTARIQEAHLFIIHEICEQVDDAIIKYCAVKNPPRR